MNCDKAILFESNPLPMWIYDVKTLEIKDVNKAAIDHYGYTRDEFLSLKIPDFHLKEDIPKVNAHFEKINYGIENVGLWRHLTKDNRIIHVDITAETYEDSGNVYRIVAIQDVSDKLNVKKLQTLSLNQLRYHLKYTPLLFIEWNDEVHIRSFSREILDRYGFSYHQFYNKTPSDLIQIAVRDKDKEEIKNRIYEIKSTDHTSTNFELQFFDAHGNIVYSEWYNSILRDENNQVISILSFINDVTEKQKADNELKFQNELFEAVIQSLPGIFYMFDENGNYVKWNRNFEKLLGRTTEEFARGHLLDHYDEEDKEIIKRNKKIVMTEGETEFTAHILAADGSKPAYLISGILCNFKGKRYVVGNGFDITKLENTENELKDALHSKDILLSEIHHRVKNNLAVISGLLELATSSCESTEAKKTLWDSMRRIKSMALIHEELYQANELSRIPMKRYLSNLINMIVESMSMEDSVYLKMNIDDLLMNINQAIPVSLILNEMITNSLKHAFPDKRRGTIGISFKSDGKNYILEEYDNGIGMNSVISQRSTLGLTLIDTLKKQLNANLNIHNNTGTKYILSFPIKDTHGMVTHFYN